MALRLRCRGSRDRLPDRVREFRPRLTGLATTRHGVSSRTAAKTLRRTTHAAGLSQTKVEFTVPTAELDFQVCKTVPREECPLPRWRTIGPARHPGPASESRHGGMRAKTRPPQPNKKIAVDATIPFLVDGDETPSSRRPSDGRQGDS